MLSTSNLLIPCGANVSTYESILFPTIDGTQLLKPDEYVEHSAWNL